MNALKRQIILYKIKDRKRKADEYYDNMINYCKYVSANNSYFAFIITRKGYYGKPVIRPIDSRNIVCFYEGDAHIIVKNGKVYSLQER